MILVKREGKKILITGHSLYDDFGRDIVCSSVSSIVTTTINGILEFDENALNYRMLKNGLEIEILKNDEITLKLISNMFELLEKLSSKYPKNIRIKEGV